MAYDDAFAAAPQVALHTRACPRFVEFVEARRHQRRRAARPSRTTTSTRSSTAGVDTLVLGCTHYPLLTGVISYVMGDDVTLVSAAPRRPRRTSTARWSRAGSRARRGAAGAVHRFLATGDPDEFRALGRRFLGPEVGAVEPRSTVVIGA